MKWLTDIVGGLVSPITGFFAKKNDNKTALRQQQITRIMNSENKEGELETILSEGMRYSWKDEYWTIVLSIPAIACFFPAASPHIEQGFLVLKSMPEYYQYWLGVCVLTSFGLRIKK
jgi:hypothetical protein